MVGSVVSFSFLNPRGYIMYKSSINQCNECNICFKSKKMFCGQVAVGAVWVWGFYIGTGLCFQYVS